VKAHAGIEGNKIVDTLAKEAAQDEKDGTYVYNRIPISTIASRVKEEGLKKWQAQWEKAVNGASCRSFFPKVDQRLKLQIPITLEFTAIISGHGKTKAYLNRFKLTDSLMCPCNEARTVHGTHNLCMQYTGTQQKRHDKTHNDQRRDLAPHKQ